MNASAEDTLAAVVRPEGLYVPALDLHLDPSAPVARAFVSHAHGDHVASEAGGITVASRETAALLAARFGLAVSRPLAWDEAIPWDAPIGPCVLSLVPAGHVLGAAQLVADTPAGRLVYTGDYQSGPGLTHAVGAPVACDVLVVEATFGLPIFRFPPRDGVRAEIAGWCAARLAANETPVVLAYALGKAQEICVALAEDGLPIVAHGAVRRMCGAYESLGIALPATRPIAPGDAEPGVLVVPPWARGLVKKRKNARIAYVSGWARIDAARERFDADVVFTLSDHADFDDLLFTVRASGARRVYTTYGHCAPFAAILRDLGIDARPLDAVGRDTHEEHAREAKPVSGEPTFHEQSVPMGPPPNAGTLRALSETFEAMRATRSPRAKEALLGDFLLAVAEDDTALQITTRLCAGRGLAAGDPRNIGVGWSLVMEVASGMTGYAPGILSACARATGDLGEAIGLLVERLPGADDRPGLSLVEVAALWDRLASTPRRTDKGPILFRALATCSPVETKYLLRSLGGGLRVGAQETLVLAAIARAFDRDAESVRWAFARTGDAGVVACLARDDRLAQASFEIGRPAAFMLATPLENVKTPLDPALYVIEDKIDGVRAQVHRSGGGVAIFARGLARVTEQFPEIAAAFARSAASGALDGEIVAVGPEGRPRPFMVLAERIHRKAPTKAMLARIPVAFIAYDLLADDAGETLDLPWTERRARLEAFVATLGATPIVRVNPAAPMLASDATINDPLPEPAEPAIWEGQTREARLGVGSSSIQTAFQAARERGHEGLVLKRTDAYYEAGRRTASWIKVKQAFATLDCVITAAEEGHGKRAGVWSDYTFAVWNGADLVNIGKAYSGLTDEEIEVLTARLRKLTVERFGRAHLVRPEIVLEIAFDGVQRSARHKSGFALRFPRILRLRDDKLPEQADSLATVRAIFAAQLESGHREEPHPEKPLHDEAPRGEHGPGDAPRRPKRPSKGRRGQVAPPSQLAFAFAQDEPETRPRSR